MTNQLRIAIAQLNPTVGAIEANIELIRGARGRAAAMGADLVVYPELVVTGYPIEDLALKPFFQRCARQAVEDLAAETGDGGPALLISTPWLDDDGKLYNSLVLLDGGKVVAVRHKHELPNYGVFDEKRIFEVGPLPGPVNFRDVRLGVMTCEDMWFPDVAETLAETGAEILIAPHGSPYEVDKDDRWLGHAVARVKETGLPLMFVNLIGGQDELVFRGSSFVLNQDVKMVAQLPSFKEEIFLTEWTRGESGWACGRHDVAPELDDLSSMYQAMMLGLRDYVRKNRFPGVVLGLSGGIDSALTAAVAVDALGPDKVHCVMLPTRYTSEESLEDAVACAKALGAKIDHVNIEPAYQTMLGSLQRLFEGRAADTTEENLQSRIRGMTLMALSNKFGSMLLTTGNKSEMAVGYATLYGDMCGGFSVLKDIYKTTVFRLSRWRNTHRPDGALGPESEVIPERIITKPPTAELREDQKDEDSLPPYDRLDAILHALIEEEAAVADIVARGYDLAEVARIEQLLYIAEYKRRQSPPGVKIGRKNFGRDRRYPITNGFRTKRGQ